MNKQNPEHSKRVKNLIAISSLSAIVLLVASFAWFIGMQTVSVSTFDIEIAAIDGLSLSVDGSTFGDTVTINKGNHDTVYEGNTNNWAGRGLIPMSSVGEMDATASRMMLYEKASIATTLGGYRLMASRVNNYETGDPERDGYVVFDLFIKNLSGPAYYPLLNELDEEDIFLTPESEVTVAESGVENTGIENSVRVAFAQIGRVIATETSQSVITGITCTDNTTDGVTGICRTATIWEPNDRFHVQNAINYYNTVCRVRTDAGINDSSYSGESCSEILNGVTYPTYAVKDEIDSTDEVDIYDGAEFNTYAGTSSDILQKVESFTDTMKFKRDNDRPTFMYLAPNSITKVRIYIYLEGQDIDNYDFAQIGRAISVKFGFTKQRYIEGDFGYTGPDANEGDGPLAPGKTRPVVSIVGDNEITHTLGEAFTDPEISITSIATGEAIEGATATKVGTVNVNVAGKYVLTYIYEDADGNTGHDTLVVNVQ